MDAITTAPTISEVGDLYIEAAAAGSHREGARGPKSATTLELERTYLRKQVKPRLGAFAVDALTTSELQRIVEEIAEATSQGAANATRDLMRTIYNFAVYQGLVPENVAAPVRAPEAPKREPGVPDEVIGRVWKELCRAARRESDRSRPMTNALRMLMLTGAHRNAVAGMLRSEIDLKAREWHVPASRSGEEGAIVIPLSTVAANIIKQSIKLNEELVGDVDHVFPSLTSEHQGREPVQPKSLGSASLILMKRLKIDRVRLNDLRKAALDSLPKQLYAEAMDTWAEKLDRLASS